MVFGIHSSSIVIVCKDSSVIWKGPLRLELVYREPVASYVYKRWWSWVVCLPIQVIIVGILACVLTYRRKNCYSVFLFLQREWTFTFHVCQLRKLCAQYLCTSRSVKTCWWGRRTVNCFWTRVISWKCKQKIVIFVDRCVLPLYTFASGCTYWSQSCLWSLKWSWNRDTSVQLYCSTRLLVWAWYAALLSFPTTMYAHTEV